jgi:hypothetical protein
MRAQNAPPPIPVLKRPLGVITAYKSTIQSKNLTCKHTSIETIHCIIPIAKLNRMITFSSWHSKTEKKKPKTAKLLAVPMILRKSFYIKKGLLESNAWTMPDWHDPYPYGCGP